MLISALIFSAKSVFILQLASNFPNTISRFSGESAEHYDKSKVCKDLFLVKTRSIT
jgi:hypothetical protein